jgi:hypothetical protein
MESGPVVRVRASVSAPHITPTRHTRARLAWTHLEPNDPAQRSHGEYEYGGEHHVENDAAQEAIAGRASPHALTQPATPHARVVDWIRYH